MAARARRAWRPAPSRGCTSWGRWRSTTGPRTATSTSSQSSPTRRIPTCSTTSPPRTQRSRRASRSTAPMWRGATSSSHRWRCIGRGCSTASTTSTASRSRSTRSPGTRSPPAASRCAASAPIGSGCSSTRPSDGCSCARTCRPTGVASASDSLRRSRRATRPSTAARCSSGWRSGWPGCSTRGRPAT